MIIFSIKIIANIIANVKRIFSSKAEKELIMFKLAVDMASDQIVITDTHGTIVYANKAMEKLTGFTYDEVVGKKIGSKELWGGNMSKEHYNEMWEVIRSKKSYIGEFRNRRKDGSFYDAEVHIYPILNKRGEIKYFTGLEIDISEKKQLERSKSEFVSLASHQLRSPLTSISLSLDLLLRGMEGDLNAGQRKALKEIYQGVYQTSDLVQSLLDLSRIEIGSFKPEMEPVEIKKLARSVVLENKAQIKDKEIKLLEEYKLENEIIMFDQNVIKIVLQNLLSNAVKYTLSKGEIRFFIKQERNYLYIKVADTGLGIPADEQSNIFSKFYRASNIKKINSEGSGLGLNLTKTIVTASGGEISFISKEKQGTEFKAILPVGITRL